MDGPQRHSNFSSWLKQSEDGSNYTLTKWLGVGSYFLALFATSAPLFSFGIVAESLRLELDTTAFMTGWIGSMAYFIHAAGAIFSVLFVTAKGPIFVVKVGVYCSIITLYASSYATSPIVLLLTYGCGYGVSSNLVYIGSLVGAGLLFTNKSEMRSKATAEVTVTLSYPISSLIGTQVFPYVMTKYGPLHVFQYSAAFIFLFGFLAIMVLELVSTSLSQEESDDEEIEAPQRSPIDTAKKVVCSKAMLTHPSFICYCIGIMLYNISLLIGLYNMPAAAEIDGISTSAIKIIITVQAIAQVCARISVAVMSMFVEEAFYKLMPAAFAIGALSFLGGISIKGVAGYMLLAIGTGFSFGAFSSMNFKATQETFGNTRREESWIWVCLMVGLGGLLGPILGGMVYDLSGSYRQSFEIASALMCIATTCVTLNALFRENKIKSSKIMKAEKSKQKKVLHFKHLPSPYIFIKNNSNQEMYKIYQKSGKKYIFLRTIRRGNLHRNSKKIAVAKHSSEIQKPITVIKNFELDPSSKDMNGLEKYCTGNGQVTESVSESSTKETQFHESKEKFHFMDDYDGDNVSGILSALSIGSLANKFSYYGENNLTQNQSTNSEISTDEARNEVSVIEKSNCNHEDRGHIKISFANETDVIPADSKSEIADVDYAYGIENSEIIISDKEKKILDKEIRIFKGKVKIGNLVIKNAHVEIADGIMKVTELPDQVSAVNDVEITCNSTALENVTVEGKDMQDMSKILNTEDDAATTFHLHNKEICSESMV